MRKILTYLLLGASFMVGSNVNAQVEQGSILFDAYYGFPNSTVSLYKGSITNTDAEIRGIGGTGFRFEYMTTDNLGIGIDFNYTYGSAEYSDTDTVTVYNPTTMQNEDSLYSYSVSRSVTKIRAMFRLNYHFVQTDVVDAYVGFGAGYKYRNTSWVASNGSNETELGGLFDGLFPVAVRVALGVRYYFIPNLGINAELGLGGGPVVSGGIALKF